MKYVILLMLLLPGSGNAQSKVSGLGTYVIGTTTPDSLQRNAFEEEAQSYVKGTLTLPCTHIRLFKSSTVEVAGVFITNLYLYFYDNKLFNISCDYSDALKEAFLSKHGKGVPKPTSSFLFCDKKKDEPLVMWGEAWHNADILALVIHTKGYNYDCELEEGVTLTISSQRFSALSSDCELKNINRFSEEFDKAQKGSRQKQ